METKRDQVREFIRREAVQAMDSCIADMANREQAEVIRQNRRFLASNISFAVVEEYRFLELADLMEWKRTRTRR